MAPHQQSVVDEAQELDDKLKKLNGFFGTPVFDKLDDAEKGRLKEQAEVMARYHSILCERILAFR